MADDAATQRAVAALTKAKTQNTALGGSSKKAGPSVLSRVFDVLSRPLYGVGEGLARASEAKNPVEIVKGIAGGLEGKNKTDVGMALERAAEHNPKSLLSKAIRENRFNLRAGAGLVGDIALDPTTYLAPEIKLPAKLAEIAHAGLEAGTAATRTAEAAKAIHEAGDVAKTARATKIAAKLAKDSEVGSKVATDAERSAARMEELSKIHASSADETIRRSAANEMNSIQEKGAAGIKQEAASIAPKVGTKTTKVAKEVTQDDVRKAVKSIMGAGAEATKRATTTIGEPARLAAEAAAREAGGKGALQLKFAGKNIGSSEKAYTAGKAVKEAIKGTEAGGAATRFISNASKFPERTNIFRRESEIKGIAQTNDEIRDLQKSFKGLSGEERRAIGHAREAGQTSLEVNGKDLTPQLQKLHEFYTGKKAALDAAGVPFNEIEHGVEHGDTYVHHHYENLTNEQAKNLRTKAVGSDKPGITMARKFKTMLEAKGLGYQPVEEADRAAAIYSRKANSAIARRSFVDKTVEAYGHELKPAEALMAKQAGWKEIKGIPGVNEGTWVPEHIHRTLQAMQKMHSSDADAKALLGLYDKALHNMKFGIALSPGHFARRAMTGVWQNFLDGVTNPDRYAQATRLMTTDTPEKMAFKVGEITQTGEDVKRLMREHGAEGAFFSGEFGPESSVGKFRNKVYSTANKADQYARTAHFIDALKDEGKGAKTVEDINKAAEAAGSRVRKWNGDFGDLTPLEKKFARRMVPYYSYSKATIPRQIEAIAMRPGKVLAIPKGQAAIQRLLGTNQDYNTSSMQVMPDWLRRAVNVELPGKGNFIKPSIPFQQLGQFTEGGSKGVFGNLFSQVTPALRIPAELGTGVESFTQQPITNTPRYLAGQVPILTEIYDSLHNAKTKQSDIPALSRYIAASGMYHITPAQQAAQMQAQAAKLRKTTRALKKKKASGG